MILSRISEAAKVFSDIPHDARPTSNESIPTDF